MTATTKNICLIAVAMIMTMILAGMASAVSCSLASSATVAVGTSEEILVTCSDIGTGYTVTIQPSGFSTSCITLSDSSKQVTATNPSTTFTTTGVSLACMMNVPGRTVTWTFTHSGGSNVASKTTVYNVIPTPSITPTFDNVTYEVTGNQSQNVSITLALTTSQSQVDIRNVDVIVSTNINGSIVGLANRTDLTIDVSESTTQYVTWTLTLPPLPPGATYDFNVSVSADNANSAMGTAVINVTSGGGSTTVSYTFESGNTWYMISIPVQLSNSDVSSVFADMSGDYQVWAWNGTWQSYVSYYPSEANTLSSVGVSKGYWVRPAQATGFSATGSIPSSTTISLVADWNLIGYPKSSSATVASITSGLSGTYQVWGWNSGWQSFVSYYPSEANTLTSFSVGSGYWIKPSQAQDLVIS